MGASTSLRLKVSKARNQGALKSNFTSFSSSMHKGFEILEKSLMNHR